MIIGVSLLGILLAITLVIGVVDAVKMMKKERREQHEKDLKNNGRPLCYCVDCLRESRVTIRQKGCTYEATGDQLARAEKILRKGYQGVKVER